jgi:chromate transporter
MDVGVAAVQNPATSPPLFDLFSSFLRLGVTAFGGPAMVAYIRQMAVDKRRWLDGDAFDGGVALCQAIPGATAMQTAAYVGLRARGVAGAAASFVGFGLPAFGLMLVLSAMYARTHDVPVIVSAFSGLRAIIVALVANAAVCFGKTSLKRWPHALMAALAATLFVWQASPFLVIVLAGLLAALFIPASPARPSIALARPGAPHTTKTVVVILGAATLAFLALWIAQRRLFDLAALMFRIDLFAFGGGFSSVPLMFHETVEVRRWLDGPTLLNGIVLGQVTPGPIVITATFVGYVLAGLVGAVTATVGVFLPSFLILVAIAPYFDRLRTSPRFNKIINGVLCSFVGLLLTVSARFAQDVTWDWLHLVLAVGAFAALRLNANVLWIVLIAAVLSIALCR